jgi:uncharacterized membrane protein
MARIMKFFSRRKFSEYRSVFEMEFDREIMRSERKRAFLVAVLSLFLIGWFFAVQIFFGGYFFLFLIVSSNEWTRDRFFSDPM